MDVVLSEQLLPVCEGSRPARQLRPFRSPGRYRVGNRNYLRAAHAAQRAKMNAASHLATTDNSQSDRVHAGLVAERHPFRVRWRLNFDRPLLYPGAGNPLPNISRGNRHLSTCQQRNRGPFIGKWVGQPVPEQAHVEAAVIPEPPPAQMFSPQVKTAGSPAIVEMLIQKGVQAQIVAMIDHDLGRIRHAVSVMRPAVTKFAVLGNFKGTVESADRTKQTCRNRKIVGSKKLWKLPGIGLPAIDHVNHRLTGS